MPVALHRLPCSIKYRGEARVTNFFKVTEESKSDSSCEQDGGKFETKNGSQKPKFKSQFQGQRLEGYKVKLEDIGTGAHNEFKKNKWKPISFQLLRCILLQFCQSPNVTFSWLIVESQGDCIESVQAEQSPLKVINQFNNFILWNRTLESGIHDNLRQSVEDWPAIANLVHDPIE
eukprot:jgi/Bigna1/87906/estExt_fgenesh1_pg.C_250167